MTNYIPLIANEVSKNIRPNIESEIANLPEDKRGCTNYGMLKMDIVKSTVIQAFKTILPLHEDRQNLIDNKDANMKLQFMERDFVYMLIREEFSSKK